MTFILDNDFKISASILDDSRLWKQVVEGNQIVDSIIYNTGWKNHPITKAWKNNLDALKYYINIHLKEFIKRQKKKNKGTKVSYSFFELPESFELPWWTQWDRLIYSHRAMLLRKKFHYYNDKFDIPDEYMQHGYIWPDKLTEDNKNDLLELISAPIPEHLINPRYCPALIKSGPNKGNCCNNLIKNLCDEYCGVHKKLN